MQHKQYRFAYCNGSGPTIFLGDEDQSEVVQLADFSEIVRVLRNVVVNLGKLIEESF